MHSLGKNKVCFQIGLIRIVEAYVKSYTKNSIPDCDVRKNFWINKIVWQWLISPSKKTEKKNKHNEVANPFDWNDIHDVSSCTSPFNSITLKQFWLTLISKLSSNDIAWWRNSYWHLSRYIITNLAEGAYAHDVAQDKTAGLRSPLSPLITSHPLCFSLRFTGYQLGVQPTISTKHSGITLNRNKPVRGYWVKIHNLILTNAIFVMGTNPFLSNISFGKSILIESDHNKGKTIFLFRSWANMQLLYVRKSNT